jgi:predicted metal-dependent hydrolase
MNAPVMLSRAMGSGFVFVVLVDMGGVLGGNARAIAPSPCRRGQRKHPTAFFPPMRLRESIDWPEEYLEFIRLFNERDFFESHEVLEDLWVVEVEPLKTYYKGLIQWAVALCHWERGNPSGARKLYLSGTRYLEPYPDGFEAMPLAAMREVFADLFAPLLRDDSAPFPSGKLPVLKLADSANQLVDCC